jgi:plastocyanin
MRPGLLVAGLVGSIVIGGTFWLALFGFVQLNRPAPVVGPGVAALPAPAIALQPTPQAKAQAPATAGQAQPVKIVATDLKFDLKEIKVAAGQSVEVTLDNKGVLEHDVALHDPAFKVMAAGGQTARGTFTPAKEGTYEFFCSIPGRVWRGVVCPASGPAGHIWALA